MTSQHRKSWFWSILNILLATFAISKIHQQWGSKRVLVYLTDSVLRVLVPFFNHNRVSHTWDVNIIGQTVFSSYSKETRLMTRENAKGKRNLPHVAAFQDLLEPVYKFYLVGSVSQSFIYRIGVELLWQLKRKMRVKPPCSRMSVGQEVWARRRKTMGNNLFPRSSSFFALLH